MPEDITVPPWRRKTPKKPWGNIGAKPSLTYPPFVRALEKMSLGPRKKKDVKVTCEIFKLKEHWGDLEKIRQILIQRKLYSNRHNPKDVIWSIKGRILFLREFEKVFAEVCNSTSSQLPASPLP